MKLIQTIAAGQGFREPEYNPTRLKTLRTLLDAALDQRADLLLLPGGFLTARTERELPSLVAQLTELADVAKLTIAVGVDLPEPTSGKAIRSPQLPYFGFVCGTTSGGPWRQTSSTGENAADVAEGDVPGANRVVSVAGSRVGVLICGELFSWWARQSFAELELELALDLGHYGMGTGVTRACENISRNGECAVAHTHHVAGWNNQSLHFVRADGVRESMPLNDCEWVGDDEFWIAWCSRTI
ncbi:MAG: hypothetical protein C0467_30580 [Planctomycetaceae bacterium]|nr:hypothetical protein [Planctomycetaceae bacterium]